MQAAFAEDGTPAAPRTRERARKLFDELESYARALRAQRERPRDRSECAAQEPVPDGRPS